MVTACRPFSFAPLIWVVWHVYPQVYVPCHNCALHLRTCTCVCACTSVCTRTCQHIMSKCVSVQYACVWLVLAAWGMRGVRPECMAWFLPECRWIMTAAGLSAAPGLLAQTGSGSYSSVTFMVTARLAVYIYIQRAAGKTFQRRNAEMFVLGGSHKPPHPPLLSPSFSTPHPELCYRQDQNQSFYLSYAHTHWPTQENTRLHQCMVHMLHNKKQTHYIKAMVHPWGDARWTRVWM